MGATDSFANAWDLVKNTAGENLPADKLMTLQTNWRSTLARVLHSMTMLPTGYGRSGVLEGLEPAVDIIHYRSVRIYKGMALDVQYSLALSADVTVPAVLETDEIVAIDAGDAVHPRLDVICLRATEEDSDFMVRTQRQADGTKIAVSLAQRVNVSGTLVARKGSPAASPTLPALNAGDIPLCVVNVEAGLGNVVLDPANVYDARILLEPSGSPWSYGCSVLRVDAMGGETFTNGTASRNVHPVTDFHGEGSGIYSAVFRTPGWYRWGDAAVFASASGQTSQDGGCLVVLDVNGVSLAGGAVIEWTVIAALTDNAGVPTSLDNLKRLFVDVKVYPNQAA